MFLETIFPRRRRPKRAHGSGRTRSAERAALSPATMQVRPKAGDPAPTAILSRIDFSDPSGLEAIDATIGGTVHLPVGHMPLPPSQQPRAPLGCTDETVTMSAVAAAFSAPHAQDYPSGEGPVDVAIPGRHAARYQPWVERHVGGLWLRPEPHDTTPRDQSLAALNERWLKPLGREALASLRVEHSEFPLPVRSDRKRVSA